jgi:hypothetical protein
MRTGRNRQIRRLVFGVMLVMLLAALLPAPVAADGRSESSLSRWRPLWATSHQQSATGHYWRPFNSWKRGIHSFRPLVLLGTVDEVGETELSLELELEGWGRGQRWLTHIITLAVDENAILLTADLAPLALSELEEGDVALVAPRFAWGAPAVQLLYAGTPEELADHSYQGRLVSVDGNTLLLEQRRREQDLTVTVDDATIWLDGGHQGRPAELPEGLPLRVLGVEQEDASVRAVLITTSRRGL